MILLQHLAVDCVNKNYTYIMKCQILQMLSSFLYSVSIPLFYKYLCHCERENIIILEPTISHDGGTLRHALLISPVKYKVKKREIGRYQR